MDGNPNIEYQIQKFISKYKAAYPDKEVPSREEIEAYINERTAQGKHIIYPLAGLNWNEGD